MDILTTDRATASASPTAHIEAAAAALRQARSTRIPIAPIAGAYGIRGADDAYAVAEVNTRLRLASGRRIVGKKIGLTSRAVQRQLGVDQPDYGVLFDDMELLNGAAVPLSRLIQPKVEAEVAFVVARDLGERIPSWAEFVQSIAYALPAIEIVDSAIADWKISLEDTVADNASSALYVLGDQPVALGSVSLAEAGMQLALNGDIVSVGSGAACLDHPLRAAFWLATIMARRGVMLRAGEVILSGALGPMAAVKAGDRVECRVGGLGTVSCRFTPAMEELK